MLLAFIFTLIFTQSAFAGPVKIVVNGNTLSVNGEIVNGRTLVPVREIAEALGADVNWDSANNEVKLTKTGTDGSTETVSMAIGSNVIKMNGNAKDNLDVPPQIINGKTMIPVRAVSQCFDSSASWDGSSKTVSIKVTLKNDGEDLTLEKAITGNAEQKAIDNLTEKNKGATYQIVLPEWMDEGNLTAYHIYFMHPAYAKDENCDVGLYYNESSWGLGDELCDLAGFDEGKEGIQTVNGIRIKVENRGEYSKYVYFNSDDLVSKGIITPETYTLD